MTEYFLTGIRIEGYRSGEETFSTRSMHINPSLADITYGGDDQDEATIPDKLASELRQQIIGFSGLRANVHVINALARILQGWARGSVFVTVSAADNPSPLELKLSDDLLCEEFVTPIKTPQRSPWETASKVLAESQAGASRSAGHDDPNVRRLRIHHTMPKASRAALQAFIREPMTASQITHNNDFWSLYKAVIGSASVSTALAELEHIVSETVNRVAVQEVISDLVYAYFGAWFDQRLQDRREPGQIEAGVRSVIHHLETGAGAIDKALDQVRRAPEYYPQEDPETPKLLKQSLTSELDKVKIRSPHALSPVQNPLGVRYPAMPVWFGLSTLAALQRAMAAELSRRITDFSQEAKARPNTFETYATLELAKVFEAHGLMSKGGRLAAARNAAIAALLAPREAKPDAIALERVRKIIHRSFRPENPASPGDQGDG